MKMQFSLATLLILVAVTGAVARVCISIPVNETITPGFARVFEGDLRQYHVQRGSIHRSPNLDDVARRMAWAESLTIAATFLLLWSIRRLKSRRENGPPVG
jgi:hypothetical protein